MHSRFPILLLSLIATSILVSACSDPTDSPSTGYADIDSALVQVLIDLHEVDAGAFLSARAETDQSGTSIANLTFTDLSLRDSVLNVHGLNEDSFASLIEDQLLDPERFLATYNRVLDRASVQGK